VDRPRLTKELLARSRVIARGRRIRDLDPLLSSYGGQPARWVKKSSPELRNRRGRFEYHWYEHHGLGRAMRVRCKRAKHRGVFYDLSVGDEYEVIGIEAGDL